MTLGGVFTVLAIVTAAFYLGTLLYAVRGSRFKRELYLIKALLMVYFIVLAMQRLSGYTYLSLSRLFVPALTALFFAQAISTLVDASKRD